MKRKVACIGVGRMGRGVCHNLIQAGYEVSVYDVSNQAMQLFNGEARLASDAEAAFDGADVALLSLPNSEAVEMQVERFLKVGVAGKAIIDLSTSFPSSTRSIYEKIMAAGGNYIDSPLSGGPKEAWDGSMSIMVGGDRAVVESCSEIINSYCSSWRYTGPSGSAHLMKLAQNWAGLMQALVYAQLYSIVDAHGVTPKEAFDILNTPVLDNWMFRFYSEKYVQRDYRLDFALQLGLKDIKYMKRLCDELGVPGYMLDGAIKLCEDTLGGAEDRGAVDMSFPAEYVRSLCKRD